MARPGRPADGAPLIASVNWGDDNTTLAKVDPLGYYLAPFGYASGQLVEAAVKAVG